MQDETEIDRAHAIMEAAPEDAAARLRFYERMADSELFLLLSEEAKGDDILPEVFDVDQQRFVLVFDRIERLSAFAQGPAPYAGLSGRALVGMLAGQGIGLGLNLDVAPSAMLIGAEGVEWLARTLADAPEEIEARLRELTPPGGLPETVLTALDRKLAMAGGLASLAYLVGAELQDGTQGMLLAFVDTVEGAETALARAVGEALTFSGIEAGRIDVIHLRSSDELAARAARVGLRFDLPKPAARPVPGANPGMDPDKPPKLR